MEQKEANPITKPFLIIDVEGHTFTTGFNSAGTKKTTAYPLELAAILVDPLNGSMRIEMLIVLPYDIEKVSDRYNVSNLVSTVRFASDITNMNAFRFRCDSVNRRGEMLSRFVGYVRAMASKGMKICAKGPDYERRILSLQGIFPDETDLVAFDPGFPIIDLASLDCPRYNALPVECRRKGWKILQKSYPCHIPDMHWSRPPKKGQIIHCSAAECLSFGYWLAQALSIGREAQAAAVAAEKEKKSEDEGATRAKSKRKGKGKRRGPPINCETVVGYM